jgi:dihydrofolate synthase / folylpolyglutamate synthase
MQNNMNYKEVLQYLFSAFPMYQRVGNIAYKANLDNSNLLDEYFEFPHRKYKTIHVAGTNGKGSVSHMLASTLQSAGYKTGLYTSPHLIDFRERIRVEGKMITEEYITDFTNKHKTIFEQIKPSFFEMTVFMAFDYFAFEKVDIAVIEVGLGGRLDSTNVIVPEISVITNISMDHTQILGNTVAEIAREKAGIIKETVPVVIGETHIESQPVFDEIATENNSEIFYADKYYTIDDQFKDLNGSVHHHFTACPHWNLTSIILDLKGVYQRKNLQTVLMTLSVREQKGIKIGRTAIQQGLENVIATTGLLGRWQEIKDYPLIVCDTAHNYSGIKNVLEQIENTPYCLLHMVLGFVADKDVRSIAGLLPKAARYYLCEPNIPRAKKLDELKIIFDDFKLKSEVFSTVVEAFQAAVTNATESDFIYIGGSTFVVADFLKWKSKSEKDL